MPPPTSSAGRTPRCSICPIMGIIKAVVRAAGIISMPACSAVQPSALCRYSGTIKVLPYRPKPMMNERMVPMRRLPFFSTLRSTIGLSYVSSRHRKNTKPSTAVTVSKRMALLSNQSSSCPFSSTYCRSPQRWPAGQYPTSLSACCSSFLHIWGYAQIQESLPWQ